MNEPFPISNDPTTAPREVQRLADDLGGKIEEVGGPLPDGSGFAVMSSPLPKDHWLTVDPDGFNVPPMPFRMGTGQSIFVLGPTLFQFGHITREEFAEKIRAAAKYAIRASTDNGKEPDFDPGAMVGNFVCGMLGYWTETGLSSDEWANPKG